MEYPFQKIESRWQKKWVAEPPQRPIDPPTLESSGEAKKYYALVEFPYPSGSGLHIGHAFTNTLLDVLARQKRMAGENVLYPMGWDAFGLPTENYAIKTGIHPSKVTRENTARFKKQNQRLGMSFDWEREIDTTDPKYYRWTQWIFLQLFKHGLAYKAETPVGWCPKCKIILANEEIVAGKCERCGTTAENRRQKQWLLRITAYADRLSQELDLVDYPAYVKKSQRDWIGRTEGVTIDYPIVADERAHRDAPLQTISCYSTRPETNFGATFIVLSPEYPNLLDLAAPECREKLSKYIKESQSRSRGVEDNPSIVKSGVFTGKYAVNRLTGRHLPIWVADFVVVGVGTEAVVGVPAHDQRDFDFAKKYDLEIIPVVRSKKTLAWDYHSKPLSDIDVAEVFNSDFLTGLSVTKAKEVISAYLVKKGWGKRAVNYHLRDWIFSRQHYWGEPIPMVYCPKCTKNHKTWWDTHEGDKFLNENFKFLISNLKSNGSNDLIFKNLGIKNSLKIKNYKLKIKRSLGSLAGWYPLDESQLPLKLPEIERYQPTDTGESPLAKITDWVKTTCPACGGAAKRETDTMPNWAGSSWYYLAYCCAKEMTNYQLRITNFQEKKNIFAQNKKLLDYWLPVDLYLGGAEHTTLHLLYSRFWHKFLNDIGVVPGKEPYAARRQHGVILGPDGSRMSKTRGNIVNPEEIMEKYGADTLRLYLLFMGPYDSTMPWDPKGVEGMWRFLQRVWRLINQLSITNYELNVGAKIPTNLDRIMHRTIKKVTQDIENLKFNTAIAALMEYVNELYVNYQLRIINYELIKTLVLLLAPFAPFMAEELWTEVLKQPYSVHQQPWPNFDPILAQEEKSVIVVQVNGKLRGQIKISPTIRNSQFVIEKLAKADPKIAAYLEGKIKRVIYIPDKLLNFVI